MYPSIKNFIYKDREKCLVVLHGLLFTVLSIQSKDLGLKQIPYEASLPLPNVFDTDFT